jgi:hypothetical protein
MTATGILDHSARIEQSLTELNFRACQMGEQVQSLEQQVILQLNKLIIELDKERNQSRKFIPLYDREKFYQWNERYLDKFNRTLLKLFLETRQYERLIQNYNITILQINKEVAHA